MIIIFAVIAFPVSAKTSNELGGLSFSNYCVAQGYKTSKLAYSSALNETVWYCIKNNVLSPQPIYQNAACVWQYKNPSAYASHTASHPYSYKCYVPLYPTCVNADNAAECQINTPTPTVIPTTTPTVTTVTPAPTLGSNPTPQQYCTYEWKGTYNSYYNGCQVGNEILCTFRTSDYCADVDWVIIPTPTP